MQAVFLILASIFAQAAPLPVVEQSVELISISHLDDGVTLVFFWDLVQKQWTCLDHRWLSTEMTLSRSGDEWLLIWTDENYDCFRVVRTRHWVESWERSNPLAENNNGPWFRRLLTPGLAQVRRRQQ